MSSPMDIFDMFFGGATRKRDNRSANVVHQLGVTLDELYNGAVRKLAVQKNVICEKCEGRGGKKGALEKCTKCNGSGMQTHVQQLGPGMVQRIQSICQSCQGQGEYINPKDRCKNCHGKKVVRERKLLEVHIDKGMEDGHKITFAGEGDQEPGLEPGDIIIVLDEKEHAVFKRHGSDIIMKMELTLVEALCGFQRIIRTLDKRELIITVLPGEVTKHLSYKCILNEGMPQYKNPFEKGKFIINFHVKFPETLSTDAIAQIEALLPPRPEYIIPDDAEELPLMDINPENDRHSKYRQPLEDDDDRYGRPQVSPDITKVNPQNSSFLQGFVQTLKTQKQYDSAFEDVETFLSPNIAEYENIKKLVYSPTGPLDRHYDDVRRFADAAEKGIKRILKAGGKRPILAILYQNPNDAAYEKYQQFDIAFCWESMLEAVMWHLVPLEIREDVPDKAAKIEALGYTSMGSLQSPVLSGIELGRIMCRDIGGSDPERMAAPNVATYVKELFVNTCIKIDIIHDQSVIEKEYPLLAAVNRAAKGVERHNARVIFLTYDPEGPIEKTVVLVGKGVTYDTGGADIKAGGVMAGMHRDKCGAAAVAGFLRTVAALKPKGVRVLGAMSMVRNSVGSNCYVSDEIITSRAGVRVRVGTQMLRVEWLWLMFFVT
ncbi:DnaJ subfamily A member 1 like protein [Argiope bruennichi]|uniref:DnaJ subfamily A member 1 like protein n=1 Tax=Argiope bruennichi TaxID=94029 RepID=A0A8T0FWJ1_ARGBR|nr:DnaJ subfamily A member 1 like protein [Argiope bruennichi]